MARPHAVKHAHHPSASPAPHQAGQQGPATSGGLAGCPLLQVGVLVQHSLIGLELRPSNVTRMMVADQHIPSLLSRLFENVPIWT
jgi:hypothetical protein